MIPSIPYRLPDRQPPTFDVPPCFPDMDDDWEDPADSTRHIVGDEHPYRQYGPLH